MAAANRALSLDPMLSEAFSARCENKFYYEYDFEGAERDCKRALELDPNSSIAYLTYNLFLNSRGRHEEAIAAVKTAIDLEPSSLFSQGMYANTLYMARRYDEAREQYIRVRELNPTRRATYEWMIRNLEAGGREEEAFEWFIRLLSFDKTDERVVERYRSIFKESGWLGVLRERERSDMDDENPLRKAGVNARIGNKDRAFELLNQAWERRMTLFKLLVHDPQFDNLRDDPRYAEMVRRIESK